MTREKRLYIATGTVTRRDQIRTFASPEVEQFIHPVWAYNGDRVREIIRDEYANEYDSEGNVLTEVEVTDLNIFHTLGTP